MSRNNFRSKHQREKTRAKIVVLLSFILFMIGIFAPVLTFQKFFIFSSTVSIVSGLFQLLSEGYPVLFTLVFGFSIVLPFFKLLLLFGIAYGLIRNPGRHMKILHWVEHYGKWSMLDVFVAALLIVTVKLGTMADVKVRYGLYAFAASVLLNAIATSRVVKFTNPPSHRK